MQKIAIPSPPLLFSLQGILLLHTIVADHARCVVPTNPSHLARTPNIRYRVAAVSLLRRRVTFPTAPAGTDSSVDVGVTVCLSAES